MTDSVELRANKAAATEIATHLARTDDAFLPRLSERVDIGEYAAKIADNAERFEAWANGSLVGLVAAYFNEADARAAYITSVSVIAEYRNQGLAARLLVECVEYAKRELYMGISLDVDRENQRAIALYEALGFSVVNVTGRTFRMHLDTREDVRMGSQT
jgi:ribosomal protein S18 acetylase RimI-like enzyme